MGAYLVDTTVGGLKEEEVRENVAVMVDRGEVEIQIHKTRIVN